MFNLKKAGSLFLLISMLALSACSAAPAPVVIPTTAPTQDLGIVRTQAAETVVAQITADALANPSATPTSEPTATETPVPPPTVAPQATSTAISTATKVPAGSSGTAVATSTAAAGGGFFYPTNTGTPYTDSAAFVKQNLADGVYMTAGQDFDAVWTVKNTGFRDWNKEFYIKYLSGNLEPKTKVYMLGDVVKRNDTVGLTADFVAPSTAGRYTSNWAIINDDGVAFFHMYIVINVK